jgi:hypothetical protein
MRTRVLACILRLSVEERGGVHAAWMPAERRRLEVLDARPDAIAEAAEARAPSAGAPHRGRSAGFIPQERSDSPPRGSYSKPLDHPTVLRTEVRAPSAVNLGMTGAFAFSAEILWRIVPTYYDQHV